MNGTRNTRMKNNKIRTLIFDIPPYYKFHWQPETGNVEIKSFSYKKGGENLAIYKDKNGYLTAHINDDKNTQLVLHRFIGEKLFGEKQKGYGVNHIDGNKLNNSKNNLEYITIAENIKHAVKNGLHISGHPERHGRYKHGLSIKSKRKEYQHNWYEKNKRKQD